MNPIVAVILALTLVNASYVTKYPMDFSKTRSIMQVMVEVENKLKNGGPLDTINNVLAGFKDAINKEQISHDEVYSAQKVECDSELSFRNSEVSDATNTLRSANAQTSTCSQAQKKANAQLEQTKDLLFQSQQHLAILQGVVNAEQDIFTKAATNYNDAITAIDDAIELAAQLDSDSSFLQIARTSAKFLKHAVVLHKTSQYRAVITAFAQMTQDGQVDQSAVERLVQILQVLKDELQDAFTQYQEENSESLATYQQQKERYDALIVRLDETQDDLETQLEDNGNCIATNTAISQTQSNKQQRNQALLNDASDLCTAVESEYTAATQGRRNELVLVAELERLVARRIAEHADGN